MNIQASLWRRKRAGFTLVEASIVLATALIVMAGIWMAGGAVMQRHTQKQAVDEIYRINNNIRDLYTGKYSVNHNPTEQEQVCGGVFPPDMLGGATTYACSGINRRSPLNAWNGTTVVNVDVTGTHIFTIRDNGLRPATCADLLIRIPATGQEGAPTDAVFFNGGAMSASMAGLTPNAITTAISAAGGCDAVQFSFRL